MTTSSVIVSACRTPIGSFLGALASFTAPQLGAIAIKEAVRRAGLKPEQVEEVIMGCVLPAGLGQSPARQAALGAGLPNTVGVLTVNKVCASGVKSVMLADAMIRAGDAEINLSLAQVLGNFGGRKKSDFDAVHALQLATVATLRAGARDP